MLDTEIELGQKVQDSISGYTGIVNTIGDHISGCTRVGVHAVGEEGSKIRNDEEFFYPDQLEILEEENEYTEMDSVTESKVETGAHVEEAVTGFEGYVVVINYHLYNCPQVAVVSTVKPGVSETGECMWFDEPRLSIIDGDDFTNAFEDLKEEKSTATGSVSDKGPSMDSP
jgi:heat shock protein HspQ